jgi:hypothetical protein
VASIQALSEQHAANVLPVIREIRRAGATSLHQIADALNAREHHYAASWAVARIVGAQHTRESVDVIMNAV